MTPAQQAILILWQRVNTSLSAFYKLIKHFGSAEQALQQPAQSWIAVGIHHTHIKRQKNANTAIDKALLDQIELSIKQGDFKILFLEDEKYPNQLKNLFDAPPILFYKGNVERLSQAQIAIVGSRKPTQKAQKFTFDMAQYLAQSGYVITSGLAQGVDLQAHLGALSQDPTQQGLTVGVMGTGVDVCYPKAHQPLFDRIIAEGGCLISELFPGTLPHKHTFPKRNRIVAGLCLGTIVTEATVKSGSLITARLTSDQGRQVFALPSSIDNSNAEGCHHLIREGATLIYHPDQVIEELSNQMVTPVIRQAYNDIQIKSMTQNISRTQSNSSSKSPNNKKEAPKPAHLVDPINIPKHLQSLWIHIDFIGQDLDALIHKTQLETATLLSQLMELELLSAITQETGRYKRL